VFGKINLPALRIYLVRDVIEGEKGDSREFTRVQLLAVELEHVLMLVFFIFLCLSHCFCCKQLI